MTSRTLMLSDLCSRIIINQLHLSHKKTPTHTIIMKLYFLIALPLPLVSAFFVPSTTSSLKTTELTAISRRDALLAGTGLVIGTMVRPNVASAGTANPFLEEEVNFEPSQMAKPDKVDINGAFVVSEVLDPVTDQ